LSDPATQLGGSGVSLYRHTITNKYGIGYARSGIYYNYNFIGTYE